MFAESKEPTEAEEEVVAEEVEENEIEEQAKGGDEDVSYDFGDSGNVVPNIDSDRTIVDTTSVTDDVGDGRVGRTETEVEEVEEPKKPEAVAEEEEVEEAPSAKTFEVTAYTSGEESTGKTPGDESYGVTASGTTVTEGRTVACPSSIPFGTTVDIEGVGERVCEDRGGAITEGRIDVYMSDLGKALEFGRQSLEVRILN